MPALFVFLIKVNVALLLFCAGYYLVLRHLTFYTLNRIYLIAAIFFSTIYPEINISGFLQKHQQIAAPMQQVAISWQAPANAVASQNAQINYWFWAEIVLWAGVVLFAIRLLIQFYSLFRLYRRSVAGVINDHNVRIIKGKGGPFSFWKSIFINPDMHEPKDLQSILLHEQVHVNEWHTADILIAELTTVLYWFNPGVWLMKKAVRENIEFITDRKILRTGTDSRQYQYSLVNASFSAAPQGIVNHFNISTVKKRIIMMNAKRSSKFKLTRYAFLVPAVVALLLIFSISKAAFIKNPGKKAHASANSLNSPVKKEMLTVVATTVTGNPSTAGVNPQKVTLASADTLRKGSFFLSTSGSTDSLNYVIDGVKSTKADVMKLDDKKIYSINMLSGEASSKLLDNLDKKHSTLFVTTQGSEAGKKFKEKVDNVNGNRFYVASSAFGSDDDKATTVQILSDHSHNQSSGGNNEVVVSGYASPLKTKNLSAVVVQGRPLKTETFARVYTDKLSTDTVLNRGYGSYSVSFDTTVAGRKLSSVTGNITKLRIRPMANTVWTSNSDPRFNLDDISDKMIIINGKVASESDLKKLSAFDIGRIAFKNDEELKELYGNKAQNGIIFIVTKKASKK
ncbi:MAG TPA: M56 family metallopeptidase [Mucilaginibacter sp.]|nr:M56 family metallopeptidase [Mucilaginibacter sp.]